MIKEIIVVALALTFVNCAKVIPIKQQGKNFPVPQANPANSDDYFDDQFYPDINDEKIGEAPRDNRGKTGGGGTGASSGGRQGGARPGKGGKRPGQGSRRPGGTRPGQGGIATQGDTSSVGQRKPQKGGRGNGQGLKAKYANTPVKSIFKSPHFNDAGITPTVKYFKTKNKEHIMARGGANDEFVLEILEGDTSGLRMSVETVGSESRAVLKNPNEKSIVGRVKTYKDGYRRSG
uniref:30 kDa phlebotomine family n=1 Tax=Nyssomyia intermedia TaxID=182990 RepID=J7HIG5_9DIPT